MVPKGVFNTKAYVGGVSRVIVVGVVRRYVLASVLARQSLVGNFLREHHRHFGSAFSVPAHRKTVAGLGFVKSGIDCEYSASKRSKIMR